MQFLSEARNLKQIISFLVLKLKEHSLTSLTEMDTYEGKDTKTVSALTNEGYDKEDFALKANWKVTEIKWRSTVVVLKLREKEKVRAVEQESQKLLEQID